jgi:hypothetical protein
MNRRDEVDASAAVATLLRKDAGGELRRCASATLAALGVDEYTALAEARAAVEPSGAPGTLRKDAGGGGGITVRSAMDGGRTLSLEMSEAETSALGAAVADALAKRGVRWT